MEKKCSEYIVETTETYIGDVMVQLDTLGAWLEDLENCSGSMRLRFRVVKANMRGFEDWLKRVLVL